MNVLLRCLRRPRLSWMVALYTALLVAVSAAWIARDRQIGPPPDSEFHLGVCQAVARAITLDGPGGGWSTLRTMDTTWPPVTYVVQGVAAWLLGDDSRLVRIYGLLALPLLAWAVYLLGRRIYGPRSGALAAVLTLFSTGISGQVRQVSLDLPCTVAVVFGLVWLVRTHTFARRRETLLLGLVMGVCLLVRIQALFFLAGPVLVEVVRAMRRERGRGRLVLLAQLGGALAMMALVSAPWWAGRLQGIVEDLFAHTDPSALPSLGGEPGFGPGLLFYAGVLGKVATWPVFGLALAGIAVSVRRGWPPPGTALVLAAGIGGILLNAVTVAREARYALPLVPLLALLAAVGLRGLAPRRHALLGALLMTWVVGTTLLLAVQRPPAAVQPFLERPYVREPVARTPFTAAVTWLRRTLPVRGDGGDVYLELRGRGPLNMRLANYLTPAFPRMAWCVAGYSPQSRCASRARRTFVIGTSGRLDLPEIAAFRIESWGANIRLYRGRDR